MFIFKNIKDRVTGRTVPNSRTYNPNQYMI